MPGRRSPVGGSRRYPRSARVNEILREVLAEAIERMAGTDDRLYLVTVTAVETDPDLRQAKVLFASLSDDAREALDASRVRLQAIIAGQVRLKRTPQLSFATDPAVTSGDRIEEILRNLHDDDGTEGGV